MKCNNQNGWSLPFIPIILLIIGILIYYFGWNVLIWLVAIIIVISLGVNIYEQITGNDEFEVGIRYPGNVDSAINSINEFEGEAANFSLHIHDDLQDPVGANMAMITDAVLNKGWVPNGYDQFEGYKIYYYKDLE